mmetsp:Transcript_50783/g.84410  ORF Transcript_50783/g.84410 Transcript_50783/m.84410 type:complete len:288 (-) Transcript_50783:22-885(-)|eukprot:CAMPEP_0202685926 /NCGR_PEP_ID=MMETSP1385-20130828/1737_1 /ASSEMBLY_ACC=CAM_ASM_000861 /TAXON_ID=933848 /ORGANISM="Elphidium margaritaceum" /LENGTH=287 /DNA_ID=CAMNT_0049340399 /DNA_START=87 /DNA_END=950 /DNA_ORIENTATION=-
MSTSSRSFQRKLRALEYPRWNKFDITDMQDRQTLIVYLEQTKICELKVEERRNLKRTNDKQWVKYFDSYLSEIESCPYRTKQNMNNNDWKEIIEWLVQEAVARCYSDKKDDYNRRTPIRRVERREYALSGCDTPQCEQSMNELCKYLNLPHHEDKVVTAQTLYNFIKTKFSLSSITNYEATLESKDADDSKHDKDKLRKQYGQLHDPWKSVNSVDDILKYYGQHGHMGNYLGFSTGDKYVDAAAIIMRVFYVLDVRQSQNQLNEIVTFLQRFTANPRTNPDLGKVGR